MTIKTTAASVLLWLRDDLPREQTREHWRGAHAQLVARTPGVLDYRQHHFDPDQAGLWPSGEGVETEISASRRVGGMPEVTFEGAFSSLKSGKHNKLVFADEANAFRRSILYLTGPGGGRRHIEARGDLVGFRAVVLLRRRQGMGFRAFSRFVNESLGGALASAPGLTEVHTQAFLPWIERLWDTPGVAHDNPADQRYHGSLVLGARDREALEAALASDAVSSLIASQREHCVAIHAYTVADTYTFRRDGRPTLPQIEPASKPRLEPVRRELPPPPARAEQSSGPDPFPTAQLIPVSGYGPEDVVVDAEGRLLCGVEGGRLLRIDPERRVEETIADTDGRPLGLEVLEDGRVLVCDAKRGLLRLDPSSGELETLVRYIDGVPLRFCSNAAAAADGTIWFTESTNRYDFEHFLGALLEHRPSGRLFRRDPDGTVETVLADLHFPNGVALTADQSALLFAETGAYRLSRLEVSGPAAGSHETLADNLPGLPDNLSRQVGGRFWLAMVNPRDRALDRLGTAPLRLRRGLWRTPERMQPEVTRTTWVIALDQRGKVLTDLQQERDDYHAVTGVAEANGRLFLASVEERALLALDLGSR